MTPSIRFLPLLLCGWLFPHSAQATLDNIRDVRSAALSAKCGGAPYVLSARVTGVQLDIDNFADSWRTYRLALEDDTGAFIFRLGASNISHRLKTVRRGDLVEVSGSIRNPTVAAFSSIRLIAHGPPPRPIQISASDMEIETNDFRLATITGCVRDAFTSDSNPDWTVMKLACGDDFVDVSILACPRDQTRLHALIGATVSITGILTPFDYSLRKKMGRILWCWTPDDIVRLAPPPSDPYAVADIADLSGRKPAAIAREGRHKTYGRVLAVWGENQLLLANERSEITRVELAEGPLPGIGDAIEVIGYPESDLYHINLLRAEWRKSPTVRNVRTDTDVRDFDHTLFRNTASEDLDVRMHGKTIRLTGRICGIPNVGSEVGLFYVDTSRQIVAVNFTAHPQAAEGLSVGCEVAVTGVCVVDTPNWTPNAHCQKTDRFFLVVRRPEDIRLLSHPSWWTPGRSLLVVSALLSVLLAILVWNRALAAVAERRSRTLLREQIGHIRANLKIDERTRLAVDLHDALSQNLTGISLQLDLVGRLMAAADTNARRHLDIAARTLLSCRNELRGCIWDLRNQALDEPSLEAAIRMTLRPHLDTARLALRVPVPRRRLDDNTAHALLRIVRELVSNALRHGAAKSIRVAGALDGDTLRVSVQDDGTGFDPSTRANSSAGHFGLDGIRERLRHFGGTLEIESRPGHGAKATFSIRLPDGGNREEPHDG